MSATFSKGDTAKGAMDVAAICKDSDSLKKAEDKVTGAIILPLAATLVYTWVLSIIARESGTLPVVFTQTSIYGPIIGTAVYALMIVLGNKFMANRKPFSFKNEMVMYNLYQAILNMYMGCSFLYEISSWSSWWGNPMDNTERGYHMTFLVWMHYNNKYIELLDTFFMVFRKKKNQISFLHVYHHALLVWSWWVVIRIAPGGDTYFGAMINSFVHVMMYTYYLFTLLGFTVPFKSWITKIQMIQFVVCASHSIYCFFSDHVPFVLPALQLFVMLNMLVLFGNFYRKAYNKPRKPKAAVEGKTA